MGNLKNERVPSTSSADEDAAINLNTNPKTYGKFDKSDEHTTAPVKSKFPKAVFLIVLNEFCERFSYYGLKTILIIYLTHFLLLSESSSTAIYHAFSMLCYFTPILGAILADAYIGQYKTIVYLSIVYCLGELVLTITSIKPLGAPNLPGPIIGLLLIAIGTGGIKPCVSAFGASQFASDQKHYLDTYFSMFYFSINLGSFFSTILTPILRNDVKCFNTDCFPVAFGVPTALMFVALVVFLLGTPLYNRKPKPSENLFKNVFHCIFHALRQKIRYRNDSLNQKENWLDYSTDRFDSKFVNDVRSMLKVIYVFIPVPVFWALFDQQGSRWTIQAQKLNTYLTADKSYALKPDQIQAINPVLILVLIPFFNWVVYPLCDRLNILKKPLTRMTVGMVFGCLAFVASGLLELQIQQSYKSLNINNNIEFVNLAPCNLNFQTNALSVQLNAFERFQNQFEKNNLVTVGCLNEPKTIQLTINPNTIDYKNYYVFYKDAADSLHFVNVQSSLLTQPVGNSEARFYSILNDGSYGVNIKAGTISYNFNLVNLQENATLSVEPSDHYKKVDFDIYSLQVNSQTGENNTLSGSYKFLNGARYTFILYTNKITKTFNLIQLNDLHNYEISIFYQLIQYVIITVGEIMFSISGLAFAYAEAPESMKSILQAAWLLTVAFGNLIVFIIAEAQFIKDQFHEYLLFAGLMGITAIIFAFVAYFYKYVDEEANQSDDILSQRAGSETKEDLVASNVQLIRMNSISEQNN